jgi:hypothetical protein
MSWRTGSRLFIEMWPLVQSHIPNREERIDFLGDLLQAFMKGDMDTYDVEDVHSDIRAAMRNIGVKIAEPERYTSDNDMK